MSVASGCDWVYDHFDDIVAHGTPRRSSREVRAPLRFVADDTMTCGSEGPARSPSPDAENAAPLLQLPSASPRASVFSITTVATVQPERARLPTSRPSNSSSRTDSAPLLCDTMRSPSNAPGVAAGLLDLEEGEVPAAWKPVHHPAPKPSSPNDAPSASPEEFKSLKSSFPTPSTMVGRG